MKKLLLIAIVAMTTATAPAATPLHYGFEAGVGVLLPGGDVSDLLKGEFTFGGALEVDYSNLRVKAGVAYGQPSLKVANPFGSYDAQGRDLQLNATKHPGHVATRVLLGYTAYRGSAVSITPLAGMVYHRLGWSVNDIMWSVNDEGHDVFTVTKASDVSLNSVSWQVAVDIDIKLHSRFVDNKRYTSSVRLTPTVTGARYHGKMPTTYGGIHYGITLSYSGLFSNIY